MEIFEKIEDLTNYCHLIENKGLKIGFVPTMGALHEGHLSLIKQAKQDNDIVAVSIFVNPRQFNDNSDYEKYPRTTESDINLLKKINCDILFLPNVDEIYDNYSGCEIDFKGLDRIYEGEFRPGHFQGVVDIVYRLFTLINPINAYFGKKDFQQLAIIKLMVNTKKIPINIVPCEIVREDSGLAISSRNKRLSDNGIVHASKIYEIISKYSQINKNDNISDILNNISNEINNVELLKTEYVVFFDCDSLEKINSLENITKMQLAVAVYCESVRLIDNIEVTINQ